MKRQTFKYPGDAAFQRLLAKYNCPTPFHVVRMRFLGEIASLDLDASPMKTIESFWDGDLPVFDRKEEASAFFPRDDGPLEPHGPTPGWRLGEAVQTQEAS